MTFELIDTGPSTVLLRVLAPDGTLLRRLHGPPRWVLERLAAEGVDAGSSSKQSREGAFARAQ